MQQGNDWHQCSLFHIFRHESSHIRPSPQCLAFDCYMGKALWISDQLGAFAKEDGEKVVDASGQRVA